MVRAASPVGLSSRNRVTVAVGEEEALKTDGASEAANYAQRHNVASMTEWSGNTCADR
jgi:hypothetical protein